MKNFLISILCMMFIFTLTACSRTADKVTSDTESITDDVKSEINSVKDKIEESDSLDLMAGITAKDAKKVALEHAGLSEDAVSDVDIDLERDNGKLIYEVDFNSGDTEYDYDIDAETGEVISASKSKD